MIPAFKIFFFFLIWNDYGNSPQSNAQFQGLQYYTYENTDSQSSTNAENVARNPSRMIFRWPFAQRNKITTRTPSSDIEKNGNAMLPNDKFIFPDGNIKPLTMRIDNAPACKGQTFCEKVADYPTDLVNDLVMKSYNGQRYESVDAKDDITFRFDTLTSESLCVSTEKIIYPKTAETVDNQWLFVVNHPNYTQGIRIETCMKVGKGCNLIGGFAEGYTTSCEQKYIYRPLTALRGGSKLGREMFRFPASCCCHVKFVGTSLRAAPEISVDSKKGDINADY